MFLTFPGFFLPCSPFFLFSQFPPGSVFQIFSILSPHSPPRAVFLTCHASHPSHSSLPSFIVVFLTCQSSSLSTLSFWRSPITMLTVHTPSCPTPHYINLPLCFEPLPVASALRVCVFVAVFIICRHVCFYTSPRVSVTSFPAPITCWRVPDLMSHLSPRPQRFCLIFSSSCPQHPSVSPSVAAGRVAARKCLTLEHIIMTKLTAFYGGIFTTLLFVILKKINTHKGCREVD